MFGTNDVTLNEPGSLRQRGWDQLPWRGMEVGEQHWGTVVNMCTQPVMCAMLDRSLPFVRCCLSKVCCECV